MLRLLCHLCHALIAPLTSLGCRRWKSSDDVPESLPSPYPDAIGRKVPIERESLCGVLKLDRLGWLNNFAIYAYLASVAREMGVAIESDIDEGTQLDVDAEKWLFQSETVSLLISKRSGPDSRFHEPGFHNVIDLARVVWLPINLGNSHWVLGILLPRAQELHLWDPMPRSSAAASTLEAHGMSLLDGIKTIGAHVNKEFTVHLHYGGESGMPKQSDGISCGVYVAIMLMFVMTESPPRFGKRDLKAWREEIAARILAASPAPGIPPAPLLSVL